MSITQQYTAVPGDTISAARWNNEFGNIYNNMVPLLNTYDAKNVKDDYSAVGDGTANDTSAVTTAVSAAYTGGFDLYWPVGTYLTTASVANFHNVRHRGPGVVKRGSDLFYIEQTLSSHDNAFYVSTSGVDTNDGLSSSYPFLTIQKAVDSLSVWAPLKHGWTIWLAAGTYSEAVALVSNTSFNDEYLIIRGPAPSAAGTASGATTDATGYAIGLQTITLAAAGTGTILVGDTISFDGHGIRYTVTAGDASVANGGTVSFTPGLTAVIPASATAITVQGTVQKVPTAIIDYPGSGLVGLDINQQNKVKVQDIKFTDWLSPAVTGVNADQASVLWCYNVHASTCRQGIVGNECQLYVQGGILHGVDWVSGGFPAGGGSVGVVTYAGTLAAIGYGGTNASNGTIIENFSQAGLESKARTHTVSSWVTYQSNETAVWMYTDCRYDDRHNIYTKNKLVYLLNRGYVVRDSVLGLSDYNFGETYDETPGNVGAGNFEIANFYQYSAEETYAHPDAIGGLDICKQRVTSSTQTGVLAATLTRLLATIYAGMLQTGTGTNGKYLEVFLCGATTGAVNTKTITLRLGGTVITTLTIATGTVTWTAHVTIWASNTTTVVQITEASNATITAVRAAAATVDAWTDNALEVWTAIPGAADTAILHEARVIKWG